MSVLIKSIVVVGSINADLTTRVGRRPNPGETLMGSGEDFSAGGKGANKAVAAAWVEEHAAVMREAWILLLQGEIQADGFERAVQSARGRVIVNLAPVVSVAREKLLKALVPSASFVVRTGETTPYANIVLRCGVAF